MQTQHKDTGFYQIKNKQSAKIKSLTEIQYNDRLF